MEPEEFEGLLHESAFFRNTMADLLLASEQTLSIVAAAVAGQIDAARLAADLLALQQAAAVNNPNPTRDHLLNAVRNRLRLPGAD